MSLLVLTTLISLLVAVVATGIAWRLWQGERARAAARLEALEEAIGGAREAGQAGRPLFASAGGNQLSGRRLGSAAGVGVAVVSLSALAVLLAGGGNAAGTKGPMPIDLLSMRHVVESDDFVVTGTVRNPGPAERREAIDAVVFLFDDKGGFLTSAKAHLAVARLGSGEEAPFRVSIPRPAGLGRYRLSFRTADGTVVPHVDRREAR